MLFNCIKIIKEERLIIKVEKRKIREKIRRKKNPHIFAWRDILGNFLKRKNIQKSDSTLNLLKYSSIELKKHLEGGFTKNMSWENYNICWQIDHIIPVSLFKDDTLSHIVNSLENLRPLDKFINISRGNKLDNEGLLLINKYKTYIKEEHIHNKKT